LTTPSTFFIIVLTMLLQKVFGAGNSDVVAIPKGLMKELGFKRGQSVSIEKFEENAVVIRKYKKFSKKKEDKVEGSAEFKGWWKEFLKENSEILDELA